MYSEVKGHLRTIDETLNGKNFLFLDPRIEAILLGLKRATEFLAKKVWDLEHPAAGGTQGFIPGSDD